MYFEALITEIGDISRQDCRPEDFTSGKSAQGRKMTLLESSKQDRALGYHNNKAAKNSNENKTRIKIKYVKISHQVGISH